MNSQQLPKKVAILAGWGRYPIVLAEALKAKGCQVYGLAIHGHADKALHEICDECRSVSPARIRPMLKFLKNHGVQEATMAGKIFKTRLFQRSVWLKNFPDLIFLKYFYSHFFSRQRVNNNDDRLLTVVVNMFADYGVRFAPATDFVPEILVQQGTLTKRTLSVGQQQDIVFGWNLAREMGRLDIGQSVAVKNQAVLAVEAVEGTDECIRRAGTLCRSGGFSVVKVAKPHQDMRFDVPTIGVGTIQTMHQAGGKVLVVEANRTIILDEAQVIKTADKLGICIVASTHEQMSSANSAA